MTAFHDGADQKAGLAAARTDGQTLALVGV